MNISSRLRPNIEAAPWVIDEVKKLESELENLKTKSEKNMQTTQDIILQMCVHEFPDYHQLDTVEKNKIWEKMNKLYHSTVEPYVAIKDNNWDYYSGLPSVESYEQKQEQCWVLVECVNMFRIRYLVQAPVDHPEYALDTVVCNEAKEFSQKHLEETIVSHRVISEQEALKLCHEDNDYLKSLDDGKLKELFFTESNDHN